jgi:stalled ribosome rescue protein Dom34
VRANTVRKVQAGDKAGVVDKKHLVLTLLVKSVDFDAKGNC